MLSTCVAPAPLIEQIPDPTVVRDRLAHALREVNLLRQMLRLAERAAKDRRQGHIGKEAKQS